MSELVREPSVARRGLLLGAGAAAAAAGTVLLAPRAAAAPPPPSPNGDVAAENKGALLLAAPADSSAPIAGYTYRTVCMYDFSPFNAAAQRQWGGNGVYSANAASALRASMIPPPGTMLQDVEFTVYNNSGASASGDVLQFTPGSGTLTQLATVSIPSTGMNTALATVPPAQAGPYPVGTVLLASVTTPTNGTVQVNAARFGFSGGGASIGLLPGPVRVYDTRTGTKMTAGTTRTVTLPSSLIAPGTTGILLNVIAAEPAGSGYLKVYPAGSPAPTSSAVRFVPLAVASTITIGISASRQIKVYASQSVHVILDLNGTLA
jgi:hypothetical protein